MSLVLLQPLLEELVFRGILQGQALRLLSGGGLHHSIGLGSIANIAVSMIFVGVHLRVQPWGWACAVVLPSLILGCLRERTGSVWPSVLVHSIYNLGFGLTAWFVTRGTV
jgi:uncharacterized protein